MLVPMDQEKELHGLEPHDAGVAQRLNWLRAGVLGANDGIVSVAAVVVGVAGATTANGPIITAGAAAVIGGAISMALGEYVDKERGELEEMPEAEFAELTAIYRSKGLSADTAAQVATELTAHDALRAHLDAELNLDPDEVLSPWHAAFASAVAFLSGAILPFATAVFLPGSLKIPVTFLAVLLALAVTGALGAKLGGAPMLRPTIRVLVGGAAAPAITFAIGSWLGVSGVV